MSDQKEVLSLKNLDAGDCTCFTYQVILGWLIEISNIPLSLHPQQGKYFREIISAIPHTQNQIGADNWHIVLYKLRNMKNSQHRSGGLFVPMQEYLCYVQSKRENITKGLHHALEDFR